MGKARKNNFKKRTQAQKADRHELYEAAVQNVTELCSFIDFTFQQIRGRKPKGFREDFCGTASAACEWVRLGKSRYAFGVDLDAEVLNWSRLHRIKQLKKRQRSRISLVHGNVLDIKTPCVDVVGAFNFSYWAFQERAELLNYFRSVFESLNPDGVFFLDAFGGTETQTEVKERTEIDGFTYVWQQEKYHPVTGRMQTHIHFEFPDGSKLKKAFSYEWRFWSLPEILELLSEAGFSNATVWFELRDENGDGLGEWLPDMERQTAPAWIANITAEKNTPPD